MNFLYSIGAACAILVAVWFYKGNIDAEAQHAAILEETAKARKTEGDWQTIFNGITKGQEDANKITNDRLDAINVQLRKRPARLPAEARLRCEGTTGAELSREDGEFLIGEAAISERRRTALEACYAKYDAIK